MSKQKRRQFGITARTMSFGLCSGGYEFEAWRRNLGPESFTTLRLSIDGEVQTEREFRGPSSFGSAICQGMDWLEQAELGRK